MGWWSWKRRSRGEGILGGNHPACTRGTHGEVGEGPPGWAEGTRDALTAGGGRGPACPCHHITQAGAGVVTRFAAWEKHGESDEGGMGQGERCGRGRGEPHLELRRLCLIFCSCSSRMFSSLTGLGMKPTSQPSFTSRPIHQSLLYFCSGERKKHLKTRSKPAPSAAPPAPLSPL